MTDSVVVPLTVNSIREKDILAANEVLNSGWLTMGNRVKEFEERMARYLGVNFFVMVNSGSSANLAVIESLMRPAVGDPKLFPGDAVLVPAIAWPTTIWPLVQLGLCPVFVDVDRNSLGLDLNSASEKIASFKQKDRLKALFVIHPLGLGIDHSDLNKFCEDNNLILINDVCESLGSFQNNIHSGTTGIGGTFSFYFSHHITTMEGGGIATNNRAMFDDLRSIRSHGWSRDRSDSDIFHEGVLESDRKFLFVSSGYNIRPTEVQAAIGISQLADIDEFLRRRRLNARFVFENLKNDNVSLLNSESVFQSKDAHSWMMLPFEVKSGGRSKRDEMVSKLNEQGIETRPVLTGNFLAQPAATKFWPEESLKFREYTNADYVSNNMFLIGNHHHFSEFQISYLIRQLNCLK